MISLADHNLVSFLDHTVNPKLSKVEISRYLDTKSNSFNWTVIYCMSSTLEPSISPMEQGTMAPHPISRNPRIPCPNSSKRVHFPVVEARGWRGQDAFPVQQLHQYKIWKNSEFITYLLGHYEGIFLKIYIEREHTGIQNIFNLF